jgi:iron complex outermembrane receptor protein
MINGHNVNNPFISSAFTHFDDFPVDIIKRIEIIRGPGSAVYGEDAFTGVINIITKDTTDIDGVSVISGYGSFDTYDENIVFGKTFGNLGISGFLHYTQTEGFNGVVESDSQTEIDKNFEPLAVPPASQAPGSVHDGRQEYDLNLKTTYKDFYFEGLYINKNKGPIVGLQSALNDETDLENNYLFIETGYKKTFEERFTIKPRIYYDQFDFNYFV